MKNHTYSKRTKTKWEVSPSIHASHARRFQLVMFMIWVYLIFEAFVMNFYLTWSLMAIIFTSYFLSLVSNKARNKVSNVVIVALVANFHRSSLKGWPFDFRWSGRRLMAQSPFCPANYRTWLCTKSKNK